MTTRIQRPRFYEGQYLGAADLTALVEYERAQLAAHILGGHSWGIAIGLRILERPSAANPNLIDVFIEPGFAWDGFGRSIVANEPIPISAELFRNLIYDPVLDDQASNGSGADGRQIQIWLRYRETATQPPRPGFEICTDIDQSARYDESYRVIAGERLPATEHDRVSLAGRQVDPREAVQTFDPTAGPVVDTSVPHQALPGPGQRALWSVPIGLVRWLPDAKPGQPGTFVGRTAVDLAGDRAQRRHVGLVAESVQSAAGILRLRDRTREESQVWSDELVWVEGDLRIEGDERLFGGALDWRTANGLDGGVPLQMRRAAGVGGTTTLQTVIGNAHDGFNRFAVGPLAAGGALSETLTVVDNGRVGIGTANPGLTLDIKGDFGRRDGAASVWLWGSEIADRGGGILAIRSGGDRVVFDGGDVVGIGSTTPRNPLAIKATGPAEELISFEDPGGATKWHINQSWLGRKGLNFVETGVEDGRLFLAAGGNVGIGTTEPKLRLDIRGDFGYADGPIALRLFGSEIGDRGGGLLYLRSGGGVVAFDGGDNVGIGTPAPVSRLHVVGATDGDAANLDSHVAVIENVSGGASADVLALRITTAASSDFNNYITFFDGGGPVGRIEGQGAHGVAFLSGGADFAEYLPQLDPAETFEPGDVVGIFAGRVSKTTDGAHHVRIVSEHPIVAGGAPSANDPTPHTMVAFLGQVGCKVRGPVEGGDLLVVSGAADGTAVAIPRRAATPWQASQAIGTAWESVTGDGVAVIRTAVGLPPVLDPPRDDRRRHTARGSTLVSR